MRSRHDRQIPPETLLPGRCCEKDAASSAENCLAWCRTVARMPHYQDFFTDSPTSGLVEAKTVCHREGG
jgi:hypothetical protein